MNSQLTFPDINLRLRQLCRQQRISIRRLAQISGVSYSSLNSMFRRGTQPSYQTLCRLCQGLHISLPAFFADENTFPILMDDSLHTLVTLYTHLSREKQQLLMAYLHGLCDSELAGLSLQI